MDYTERMAHNYAIFGKAFSSGRKSTLAYVNHDRTATAIKGKLPESSLLATGQDIRSYFKELHRASKMTRSGTPFAHPIGEKHISQGGPRAQ